MLSKLGDDERISRNLKKNLKLSLRDKYVSRGYKAAAQGKGREDNPYTLTEECWNILRKRTKWTFGWEEKAFSKTPKELEKIEKENIRFKRKHEKRLRRDKEEREEKERRKESRKLRKHKHKKHKE
jgi:ribosome modulation factor